MNKDIGIKTTKFMTVFFSGKGKERIGERFKSVFSSTDNILFLIRDANAQVFSILL